MCNGVAIPPALKGVGNARYATLSSAVSLTDAPTAGDTLPSNAEYAILVAKTNNVYISFDGADATSADLEWPKDVPLFLDNARTVLNQISILEATASASVSIAYFYGPRA